MQSVYNTILDKEIKLYTFYLYWVSRTCSRYTHIVNASSTLVTYFFGGPLSLTIRPWSLLPPTLLAVSSTVYFLQPLGDTVRLLFADKKRSDYCNWNSMSLCLFLSHPHIQKCLLPVIVHSEVLFLDVNNCAECGLWMNDIFWNYFKVESSGWSAFVDYVPNYHVSRYFLNFRETLIFTKSIVLGRVGVNCGLASHIDPKLSLEIRTLYY